MTNLQTRIDEALKVQAQAASTELGVDVATVVRIFLTQIVREKALPFTPSLDPFHSPQNHHLPPRTHEVDEPSISRDVWPRKAVHTGLQALERNDVASEEVK